MSIQEIAVNTATLQNDINDMQEVLEKVKKRTQSMFDEIMELDSMWDGVAHMAFKQQFNQDYQKMVELCNTISSLIFCMQYAKKEYEACEKSIHSIVNSIRI